MVRGCCLLSVVCCVVCQVSGQGADAAGGLLSTMCHASCVIKTSQICYVTFS